MTQIALPARLWRDGDFILFWSARTVSVTGTALSLVALPVLVYQLTGSAALTGVLAATEFLPYLMTGLLAGAIADRVDRRRLMVAMDVLNAVLLASVPVAGMLHRLTAWHVLGVGLLSSAAFVWFDAANFGALPALVGRARLPTAISSVSAAGTVADIGGPALAGVLVATVGAANAVAVDAASYLASAVLLGLVRRRFGGTEDGTADGAPRSGLWGDIRDGLRYLWRQRLLRAMTLATAGLSVTGGAVMGLTVVYAVRALRVPTDDARIGLLWTAGAAGGLVAALALPRLSGVGTAGRQVLYGLVVNALALVVMSAAPGYLVGMIAMFVYDGSYLFVTLTSITSRQVRTPDHLSSRVNASGRTLGAAGRPIGALVGGLVATVLPIRYALLAMGLGVAASVVFAATSRLRTDPWRIEAPPATG